jgi:hypothetical protein
MRHTALAILLALSLAGCKSNQVETGATLEKASRPVSSIQMGDAKSAGQLVNGFHSIEDNAWRWTERQFAVALAPPAGASQNGAVLKLRVSVPAVSIEKLKSLTLTASIDGADLAPETYDQPGQHVYQREIPASQIKGDLVKVSFTLDKAIPPGGGDLRELGIIVLSAALEAK